MLEKLPEGMHGAFRCVASQLRGNAFEGVVESRVRIVPIEDSGDLLA